MCDPRNVLKFLFSSSLYNIVLHISTYSLGCNIFWGHEQKAVYSSSNSCGKPHACFLLGNYHIDVSVQLICSIIYNKNPKCVQMKTNFCLQTLLNQRPARYYGSIVPAYAMLLIMGTWAFIVAGGRLSGLKACFTFRRPAFNLGS